MYNFNKQQNDSDIFCYGKKNGVNDENRYFKVDNTKINEYAINLSDRTNFDNFMNNEDFFHISRQTLSSRNHFSALDCENEAKKHFANFFIVNDLKKNASNEVTYKCIVPKNDIVYRPTQQENIGKDVFKHLTAPVKSFIDNIFSKTTTDSNTSTQLVTRKDDINLASNTNCIKYNPVTSSQDANYNNINSRLNGFGRNKDNYVIYQTKVTRNPQTFNATGLNNTLKEYSTFKNTTLAGYDNNLHSNINTMRTHLSTFKNRVQTAANYQTGTTSDFTGIANAMLLICQDFFYLGNNNNSLESKLYELQTDLSFVSELHTNYLNFISFYEEQIDFEKVKYKKLKTSNNGNNAKLHDSNYIKYLKLTEIITLFFLVALVIFLSVKKSKIK